MAFVANELFYVNLQSFNSINICSIYKCKLITYILEEYVKLILEKDANLVILKLLIFLKL